MTLQSIQTPDVFTRPFFKLNMSFKVEGKTTLVVEKSVLQKVAEKYGWTVEEKAKIRSHDIASDVVFDYVLRNPKTDDNRCYDVGVQYAQDGKTAGFIYDKWGDSVENQLGEGCCKFKQECGVAAMHENDFEEAHLSYEDYFDKFCTWTDDGHVLYNGIDEEPYNQKEWEEIGNGES